MKKCSRNLCLIGLDPPAGRMEAYTMSSDEMKRAVDLLAEYARTGMLCIGNDEAELLRRYARTMGEWRK